MNNLNRALVALSISIVLSAPAFAASKTVTLDVPGMTCSTCPITIKKALNKVPGVSKIDFNLEKKQAVVTFDDTKSDTKALVKATTDAGFPSQPEKAQK